MPIRCIIWVRYYVVILGTIKNITTSLGQKDHLRPLWEFYTITIDAYLWNSYHKNFVSQNVDNLYICIGNNLPNHLRYLDIDIEPNRVSFFDIFQRNTAASSGNCPFHALRWVKHYKVCILGITIISFFVLTSMPAATNSV